MHADIARIEQIDKELAAKNLAVIDCNRVDVPNAKFYTTTRNTGYQNIYISYYDSANTFRDYFTHRRLNKDKQFVLILVAPSLPVPAQAGALT